jgi:hypothetical protein
VCTHHMTCTWFHHDQGIGLGQVGKFVSVNFLFLSLLCCEFRRGAHRKIVVVGVGNNFHLISSLSMPTVPKLQLIKVSRKYHHRQQHQWLMEAKRMDSTVSNGSRMIGSVDGVGRLMVSAAILFPLTVYRWRSRRNHQCSPAIEQRAGGQWTNDPSRSVSLTATVNLIKWMKYRLFVSRYGDQSGDVAALAIWTAEIAASIHPFEQEASVVPAT